MIPTEKQGVWQSDLSDIVYMMYTAKLGNDDVDDSGVIKEIFMHRIYECVERSTFTVSDNPREDTTVICLSEEVICSE